MTEIIFNEERHEYQVDGKKIPSVTQILSVVSDFSMVDPVILARAADFGSNVHKTTELFDLGELDVATLDPALAEYLEGWKKFLDCCQVNFSLIEERLYSPKYRYSGMLDRVGEYKSKLCQFDIKTGIKSPATGPQTAAYSQAIEEMTGIKIKRRFTVQLMPNDFRLVEHTNKGDFNVFLSCLNIFNYKRSFK